MRLLFIVFLWLDLILLYLLLRCCFISGFHKIEKLSSDLFFKAPYFSQQNQYFSIKISHFIFEDFEFFLENLPLIVDILDFLSIFRTWVFCLRHLLELLDDSAPKLHILIMLLEIILVKKSPLCDFGQLFLHQKLLSFYQFEQQIILQEVVH